MKVITTIGDMKAVINKHHHQTIGLVPTMGYLHEGHVALVTQAKKENHIVVMSIFVNPTQFGPNEDFESYPRDFDRDVMLATEAGVDYIFAPSVTEMYPRTSSLHLHVGEMAQTLCGASRPNHFDGVVQIVTKLLHIIEPTHAYFGQKDAQQLAIIEALVRDYNFPVIIRSVPIIREADGLAKSSRNVYLTPIERQQAPVIYATLQQIQNEVWTIAEGIAHIEKVTTGKVDYLTKLSYPDLTKPTAETTAFILAVAVYIGTTRLIDNVIWEVTSCCAQ